MNDNTLQRMGTAHGDRDGAGTAFHFTWCRQKGIDPLRTTSWPYATGSKCDNRAAACIRAVSGQDLHVSIRSMYADALAVADQPRRMLDPDDGR